MLWAWNFELALRLIFSILSIVYVSAIFILAGSPIVRILAPFNFHSLLHIPLYGILTFLLIFSIVPITQLPVNSLSQRNQRNKRNKIDSTNPTNPINLSREMRSLFHWEPINSITRFLVVGIIALGVGIADEIHQAYVPGRDASVTDVLLDFIGISLALFIIFQRYKKTTRQHNDPTVSTT